jgi:hypothetical protein
MDLPSAARCKERRKSRFSRGHPWAIGGFGVCTCLASSKQARCDVTYVLTSDFAARVDPAASSSRADLVHSDASYGAPSIERQSRRLEPGSADPLS